MTQLEKYQKGIAELGDLKSGLIGAQFEKINSKRHPETLEADKEEGRRLVALKKELAGKISLIQKEGEPTISGSLTRGLGRGLTYNTLEEGSSALSGEPVELGNLRTEISKEAYPTASMIGEIGGGIASGGALMRGVAKIPAVGMELLKKISPKLAATIESATPEMIPKIIEASPEWLKNLLRGSTESGVMSAATEAGDNRDLSDVVATGAKAAALNIPLELSGKMLKGANYHVTGLDPGKRAIIASNPRDIGNPYKKLTGEEEQAIRTELAGALDTIGEEASTRPAIDALRREGKEVPIEELERILEERRREYSLKNLNPRAQKELKNFTEEGFNPEAMAEKYLEEAPSGTPNLGDTIPTEQIHYTKKGLQEGINYEGRTTGMENLEKQIAHDLNELLKNHEKYGSKAYKDIMEKVEKRMQILGAYGKLGKMSNKDTVDAVAMRNKEINNFIRNFGRGGVMEEAAMDEMDKVLGTEMGNRIKAKMMKGFIRSDIGRGSRTPVTSGSIGQAVGGDTGRAAAGSLGTAWDIYGRGTTAGAIQLRGLLDDFLKRNPTWNPFKNTLAQALDNRGIKGFIATTQFLKERNPELQIEESIPVEGSR